MQVPLAHELWFDHDQFPMDWSFAGQQATLALLAGAVLLTLAVRLADEAVRFADAVVLRAPRVVAALLAAVERFDGDFDRLDDDRLEDEERLEDDELLAAVRLDERRDDERRRVPVLRSFAGISSRATDFERRGISPWRNFAICSSCLRYSLASLAVSLSPTLSASASIAR